MYFTFIFNLETFNFLITKRHNTIEKNKNSIYCQQLLLIVIVNNYFLRHFSIEKIMTQNLRFARRQLQLGIDDLKTRADTLDLTFYQTYNPELDLY